MRSPWGKGVRPMANGAGRPSACPGRTNADHWYCGISDCPAQVTGGSVPTDSCVPTGRLAAAEADRELSVRFGALSRAKSSLRSVDCPAPAGPERTLHGPAENHDSGRHKTHLLGWYLPMAGYPTPALRPKAAIHVGRVAFPKGATMANVPSGADATIVNCHSSPTGLYVPL